MSILSTIKSCFLLECLLLIGCAPRLTIPLGNPFWTELGTIEAGKTTRHEVHGLLGEPWYVIDDWDVEVYFREEGAIWIYVPIPVPHMSIHYLLVAYPTVRRCRCRRFLPRTGPTLDSPEAS
jgi:hypothetical protein